MADRSVPLVADIALWEANHPGQVAPVGTLVEAEFRPTSSKLTGQKWQVCVRCGHVAKESEMGLAKGKWYCTYSKCLQEVT